MSANDKSCATYGPGRTTPPLEARVRLEVARVVTNSSNWPRPISVHMWGRDLAEPIDKLVEALLPVITSSNAKAWHDGYTAGNAHNGRRDANPYRSNDE